MKLLPVGVCLAVWVVAILAWAVAQDASDAAAERAFDREVIKVESAISARWAAHEQVLRSGVGFLGASDAVTREDWRRFVDALNLSTTYPGIQGVGWSIVVPHDGRAAHEAQFSAELEPYGFERYEIYPVPGFQHQSSQLTSIIYLEPLEERNRRAISLDMYSEPNRRAAMDLAAVSGTPALSGKILLVQEIDADVQPGFLLYLPVYAQSDGKLTHEKTGTLHGWVYSPFRAHDLMDGILGGSALDVTFEVYDGAEARSEALLFDEDGVLSGTVAHSLREDKVIDLAGRSWLIRYEATPAFDAAYGSETSGLVLGSGLVAGLLLGALFWSVGRTGERAQVLALEMTQEVRRKEAEAARLAEDLARSNESLQEFAHVASHDLQEPVRTVQSFLSLLLEEKKDVLDAEASEFVAVASDAAVRMRTLIQDLLEYSRVVGAPPKAERVALNAAAETAWKNVLGQARDAGAIIDVEALGHVRADAASVERVFTNLFSNAIKYRGEADPMIKVRARREQAMVRVEVTDNGIGVRPEDHEKLFVMYTRLHSRDEYPGNGMGLPICQRIVNKYGGEMGVESTPGQGATFWFTLPEAA